MKWYLELTTKMEECGKSLKLCPLHIQIWEPPAPQEFWTRDLEFLFFLFRLDK